jgi:hypothetical protein
LLLIRQPSPWLTNTKKIRIACAAPVLRFEPGHSRIPGVLDCNDAGRKLGGGSILVDDLYPRGNRDAPRLCQGFEPGGDVDSIAKNVAVLDDDIAHVDADAKGDLLAGRDIRVPLAHRLLHLDRAAQGIDDTGELDQKAVARGLDDAAPMFGDLGIDQFTAARSKRRESARFVLSHQTTVAGHIGGENGREPAFDPLSAQRSLPGSRPFLVCAPAGR